jgi:glucose-6-phosphate dehydrogenase assembly protein OpcA
MTASSERITAPVSLDLGRVDRYLNDLWRQMRESRVGGPPMARVHTLNLVLYGEEQGLLARAEQLAAVLPARHPGRVVAVQVNPHAAGDTVDASAAVYCVREPAGRREVCGELIALEAPVSMRRFVANVVAGVLVSDIPVAVWWTGVLNPDDALFRTLTEELADLVIVDTGAGHDDRASLMALDHWAVSAHRHATLGDLAWARTRPWRQTIADFFDQPAIRPALDRIGALEIVAAHEAQPAEALLLCGWLASRLRWRTESAEREGTGLHVLFRGGGSPVEAVLRSGAGGAPWGRIAEVRLTAGEGEHLYAFEAHRGHDTNVVHGHVQAFGHARTGRTLGIPQREDPVLVADLLDERGGDPVFLGALSRAAELARMVEE